jgi:hypothetical protein
MTMNRVRIYLLIIMLAASTLACEVELVTPTLTATRPAESNPPTFTAETKESPTEMLTESIDESQTTLIGSSVTVTRATVNLRNKSHASTGVFVQQGQMLAVLCGTDGYCEILEGEHAGLYIWRGCTSDPGEYGCEAK